MSAEQRQHFIVVWDDAGGACTPMGWDAECEGAICGLTDKVAIFTSRKDARQAINISIRFALLRHAQGKPVNTDFLEGRRNLRVIECEHAAQKGVA